MRLSILFTIAALIAGALGTGRVFAATAGNSGLSLTFAWQQGANAPAAQTVSLRSSAEEAPFKLTIPPVDTWLTATADGDKMPASLSVQVNPSGLAAGTYVSMITLTTDDGAPLVFPVALTVTPAAASKAPEATSSANNKQKAVEAGRLFLKWGCPVVHCIPVLH